LVVPVGDGSKSAHLRKIKIRALVKTGTNHALGSPVTMDIRGRNALPSSDNVDELIDPQAHRTKDACCLETRVLGEHVVGDESSGLFTAFVESGDNLIESSPMIESSGQGHC